VVFSLFTSIRNLANSALKLLTILAFVSGFLATQPAYSQEDIVFDIKHTKACLQEAVGLPEQRQCVGASANECRKATPTGGSTYGTGACLNLEAEWWDGRLNKAYRNLMKAEKLDDVENAEMSSAIPQKAPALRSLQRAWIKYRDATCEYEYTQWGGGTGGGPAGINCVMTLTGEQTIYLLSIREGF
jgi:uncharacterized protein YecT (DUF1311 family)